MVLTIRRNNKALPSSLSVQQQANKVRLGRSTAGPSKKGAVFAVVAVMALIYSSSNHSQSREAQNLSEMLQQIAEGKVHVHVRSNPL